MEATHAGGDWKQLVRKQVMRKHVMRKQVITIPHRYGSRSDQKSPDTVAILQGKSRSEHTFLVQNMDVWDKKGLICKRFNSHLVKKYTGMYNFNSSVTV